MASNPHTFTLTPGFAPAAPLMRLLSRFDRQKVEAFAEISIALLDLIDGDPDDEEVGSEDDISDATARKARGYGPGCEISDPGGQVDEDEWNTALEGQFDGFGPGCPIADPGEYGEPGI